MLTLFSESITQFPRQERDAWIYQEESLTRLTIWSRVKLTKLHPSTLCHLSSHQLYCLGPSRRSRRRMKWWPTQSIKKTTQTTNVKKKLECNKVNKYYFIDFFSQFFVRTRTCQRGCWSINDWTCWKDGAFQCWTGENLNSVNCGYQVGGSLSLDMSDEVWFNHCRLCTLHGPQENYHSPTFKHFWRNLSRKLRRRSTHCRDRRGWQSGTG